MIVAFAHPASYAVILQDWDAMDIRFGEYRVLRQERQLLGPSGAVDIGARSFDILLMLLERANSVVGKSELLDAVWPGLTVEENTLQVHISALRKLLGRSLIRTVHGRGYKYAGPEPRHDDTLPPGPEGPERAAGADRAGSPGATATDAAPETLPLPDKPSVAVLPFMNISGDAMQEYFSSGITENIIAGLTRFRGLFVVAGKSSAAAHDTGAGVRQIGQRLGVAHVVEGSVRKAGNRVRVTAQLVDAASGRHVWGEHYDRELNDIFAVQDEITNIIVVALAGRLDEAGRHRAVRKSANDMATYDYLLRGRHSLKRRTKDGVLEARRYFERGLELDPEFATVCACLADSYLIEYELDWTEARPAAVDRAFEFAERAVTLDPADSSAWHALAWARLAREQHDLAMIAIERAISLNPNDYNNLCVKGWCLALSGNSGESIACLNEAIRINPFAPVDCLVGKGIAEYTARRYEAAIHTFGSISGLALLRHACIAACYAQLGRRRDARAAIAVALELAASTLATEPGAEVEGLRTYLGALFRFQDPNSFEHLLDGLRKAELDD